MNFLKNLLPKRKKTKPAAAYTIYYRKLCQDCDKVKTYLQKRNIPFNYLDCEDKNTQPPVPVFATPALFKDNELLAYGVDVIAYFEINGA